MLSTDAKGILKNTNRTAPIFPGIRPTTMIQKELMTSAVLNFESSISMGESITAAISFISPKYYGNSLWPGKCLDILEGAKVIGEFTVTEILNPILDRDSEKWVYIDGRDIRCLNDFYNQIEYKMTNNIDFKIGRNFNAFCDLLWGGFGIHEYGEPLHIVWIFAKESKQALGNKVFDKIVSVIQEHESNNKYLEQYDGHAF